ncbi:MAG: lipoprotein signal peptidase, partial [Ottowia sp.]|nr:lipoprotein signal peptidase [Ottowia sp.]
MPNTRRSAAAASATCTARAKPARSPEVARGKSAGASLALWLALAALVVVLDQFTKQLILGNYQLGDSTYVTSFFNIVRAHNTGAAFSFLAGAGGWQRWFFVALAVGASLFIVWLLRSHPGQRLFAFSLSMILGGAVGNVIDRLMHGYVVDFLDFHWSFLSPMFYRGHFPAFNVA